MYTVSHLFIYPIKSLGEIKMSSALLTDRGFQYDRRWMLVDGNNRFLTQREYPVMSLLQPVIENDQLIIYNKNNTTDKLTLSLQPVSQPTIKVTVWEDECNVHYVSDTADQWFSNQLSAKCRLVYMPENAERKVDQQYAHKNEITSLSDGYPLLMIGQASLSDLNSRLDEPMPMDRFRPNIVFTGGLPYDEDIMEHVIINGIDLYGVKLCARCVIITINQTNSLKGKEPLKTLAGYRMVNNKVYFGQNVLFDQPGLITVGDTMEVVNIKKSMLSNNVNSLATRQVIR